MKKKEKIKANKFYKSKSFLLAESNMRKSKSSSIGIMLLILISATFISLSCLLILDYKESFSNEAVRLNTSDAQIRSTCKDIDKNYIKSILTESVTQCEYNDAVSFKTSIKMNGKDTASEINFVKDEVLNRNISCVEITQEDESISENYIYIPYFIHVAGDNNIGDTYEIKSPNKTYEFKIKGYLNTIYDGYDRTGTGEFTMMISDTDYNEILLNNPNSKAINLYLNYGDDTDIEKETNIIANKITTDKGVKSSTVYLENVIYNRTLLSNIFLAFFLMIAVVVVAIIILMITNNIANYIRQNIKKIGLLKAIGYTSSNIKHTFLLHFSMLVIIGLIFGISFSYLLMPAITDLLVAQSGVVYNVEFNLYGTLITCISLYLLVILSVAISVRKINKLNTITALREGLAVHNFKKNHIKLDRFKTPINISLSLKNMFKNRKQNIITFIVITLLSFLMVISMTIYQNFSRDPKVTLLNFYTCTGNMTVDKEIKDDFENTLKNDTNITNYQYCTTCTITDVDNNEIHPYVVKDTSLIKNKDYCYEGKYPRFDNEVSISGKYAEKYGYEIGDTIYLKFGNKKFSYIITGFTLANGGASAVLTYEAANHIVDMDSFNPTYLFDSDLDADTIIEKYKAKYDDLLIRTVNFDDTVYGMMHTFIEASNIISLIISTITASVIILVLFILIKILVYDRRYEYGILKAIGYRTKDLIIQNVMSYMFTVVVATLFGTFIFYHLTSPFMSLMMSSIGVMKCNMSLPMDLMIITVTFIIGMFLITSTLMLSRIKKIEPNKLLIGE